MFTELIKVLKAVFGDFITVDAVADTAGVLNFSDFGHEDAVSFHYSICYEIKLGPVYIYILVDGDDILLIKSPGLLIYKTVDGAWKFIER